LGACVLALFSIVFTRFVVGVLVWHLFVWKGITDEVRTFIEIAEEFR